MSFAALPATAAWSHRDTRSGFEVVYFERLGDGGLRIDGCTTALDEDGTWFVEYSITVAADWHTRAARVTGRSLSGRREVVLESTGIGHWLVDGKPAQRLNGCLDVDLESSALTNALPIQRMDPPVGTRVATPAVYIPCRRPLGAPARTAVSAHRGRQWSLPLRIPRSGLRLHQPIDLRRGRIGAGIPGNRDSGGLISRLMSRTVDRLRPRGRERMDRSTSTKERPPWNRARSPRS